MKLFLLIVALYGYLVAGATAAITINLIGHNASYEYWNFDRSIIWTQLDEFQEGEGDYSVDTTLTLPSGESNMQYDSTISVLSPDNTIIEISNQTLSSDLGITTTGADDEPSSFHRDGSSGAIFTLDSTYDFTITGDFSGFLNFPDGIFTENVGFSGNVGLEGDMDGGGSVEFFMRYEEDGSVNLSGTLPPGEYAFFSEIEISTSVPHAETSASVGTMTLTLTPVVPEPSSFLLLSLWVIGALGRRLR